MQGSSLLEHPGKIDSLDPCSPEKCFDLALDLGLQRPTLATGMRVAIHRMDSPKVQLGQGRQFIAKLYPAPVDGI